MVASEKRQHFYYVIGLGSNLGLRQCAIASAINLLRHQGEVKTVSPIYRSTSLRKGDPDFLNAACLLKSPQTPESLLQKTQTIEEMLGRRRQSEARWAPRTIDIDLLTGLGEHMSSHKLTLPHPRLYQRPFAWVPASNVASFVPAPPKTMKTSLTLHAQSAHETSDPSEKAWLERLVIGPYAKESRIHIQNRLEPTSDAPSKLVGLSSCPVAQRWKFHLVLPT